MKRVFILFLTVFLIACQSTSTPPPTTLVPATDKPTEILPPNATATPAPAETSTPPPTSTDVAAFPNPDAYTWETVVSGLERPVDLQSAGDGSGRLFIIEKSGRIRIFQDGQLLEIPFLDIDGRVGSSGNEQGLLGMAFHPNYAENGFFFVNYTDNNGDTVIARYQVTADPNIADPDSEVPLLDVGQPFRNHNGGGLAFGPDSYLYIGLGDGGSAGDPQGNAQNPATLLGKMLRLDVDGGDPYAIPEGNPFAGASGGERPEIWRMGLRNPWRFSFDFPSGNLYIGDVGQNQWEEIDVVSVYETGGSSPISFGWNAFEGTHIYKEPLPEGPTIKPVAEYSHSEGCSVTGGYVYRGSMSEWNGIYLYGDYCAGTVWGLIRSEGGWQNQVLFRVPGSITSFGRDESGEIYIVTDGGQILRLVLI